MKIGSTVNYLISIDIEVALDYEIYLFSQNVKLV